MKTRKVLGLGSWVLGLVLIALQAFGQGTPIATTGFTRTMLRGADSAAVRDTLGFLTTNNTVITNYVGNGASITNLNADELRSGTVPLARLTGITATQVADASLTTNKVDATFHALLGGGGSGDVTQAGLAAGSYTVVPAPTLQTVTPDIFGWMATTGGKNDPFSSGLSLLLSTDGTNWTPTLSPIVYHPDSYTNGYPTGPIARRWSIIDTNGYAYAAQAGRGFFGSDSAGTVEIWRSQDYTNWSRVQLYTPFAQSYIDVVGANWFRHSSGAVYLILSGTTNLAAPTAGHIWAMRATDNTFTNWATPTIIKYADVSQEGYMAQGTNGILTLIYRCIHPSEEWFIATNANNNLTTVFTPCRTNFGGSFGSSADSGGLSILNLGSGHFRAYSYSEGSGTNYYTDSRTDLLTWEPWQQLTSVSNRFIGGNPVGYYGSGIFRIPAAPAGLSNATYYVGQGDFGIVDVVPPILKARSLQAREGSFSGGAVAESFYARNILVSGRATRSPRYYGQDIFLTDAAGIDVVEISKDGFIVIRNSNNFAAHTLFSDGSITALDSDGNALWSVDSAGNFSTIGKVIIGTPTITSGAGAPSADEPKGSLYLRTDGSTSTSLYVKTATGAGAGNWTAK